MAKFFGTIGYAEMTDSGDGVWKEEIVERSYSGDIIKNSRRLQPGENLNDNLVLNNEISILSDPYANENFHKIRYANWMGSLWKVTNVVVQRPRLILSLGGVYNGQTGPTPPAT